MGAGAERTPSPKELWEAYPLEPGEAPADRDAVGGVQRGAAATPRSTATPRARGCRADRRRRRSSPLAASPIAARRAARRFGARALGARRATAAARAPPPPASRRGRRRASGSAGAGGRGSAWRKVSASRPASRLRRPPAASPWQDLQAALEAEGWTLAAAPSRDGRRFVWQHAIRHPDRSRIDHPRAALEAGAVALGGARSAGVVLGEHADPGDLEALGQAGRGDPQLRAAARVRAGRRSTPRGSRARS